MEYLVKYWQHIVIVLCGVFCITSVFLWLEVQKADKLTAELETTLQETLDGFFEERASTTETLAVKNAVVADLSERLNLTEEELEETEDDLKDTKKDLRKEKDRNDAFEEQIEEIAGTVGDLDKLSKTDEELLQKYSKVYFLNEHYVPESLMEIDNEWKYSESKPNQLHSKAMPFLEDMLEAAKDDGIDLWVVSAYRSFNTQAQLKGHYTVIYGSGANAFSADQGFSEHQLGTTVDFTTSGIGGQLEPFGGTAAYEWLLDNAHKYGFHLSYPERNGYYVYEPWHWRFVGTELAKDLHKAGASIYDWEQRDIDQYLLNIFD